MDIRERAIGEEIRRLRLKKGVTQEVLSGFADIGRSHLAEIENGVKIPKMSTLWKLVDALEIPISDFFLHVEERIAKYEEKDESKSN